MGLNVLNSFVPIFLFVLVKSVLLLRLCQGPILTKRPIAGDVAVSQLELFGLHRMNERMNGTNDFKPNETCENSGKQMGCFEHKLRTTVRACAIMLIAFSFSVNARCCSIIFPGGNFRCSHMKSSSSLNIPHNLARSSKLLGARGIML